MKRFFLFALVATVFAACSTDTTQDLAPEIPTAPDELQVSFDEEDTRIQLGENGAPVWTKGDLISVFYRSNANSKYQFVGETGDANGSIELVEEGVATQQTTQIVAVYPYSEDYWFNWNTGDVEAFLPAEQTYLKDSFGVGSSIMVSKSDYKQLSFKNVCGWLKLQFTGSGSISKIVLRGNDGEQVAGEIYINTQNATCALASDMGESGEDSMGGNIITDNTILTSVTLNCGDGVALNSETPTAFYVALPPQTFEKGFTATMYGCDGSTKEISTENLITIERNHIVPMASIICESTYDVGDLYNSNGVKGIVFQVDENKKHGKIISMTESRGLYGYGSYVRNCKSTDNGLDNKDALYSTGATYSSSYLMPPKSSVWYIPAKKELEQLIEVIDIVNKSLVSNGGKSFTFSAYGDDALYTSSTNANTVSWDETSMYGKNLSNPDATNIYLTSSVMVRCRTITTF